MFGASGVEFWAPGDDFLPKNIDFLLPKVHMLVDFRSLKPPGEPIWYHLSDFPIEREDSVWFLTISPPFVTGISSPLKKISPTIVIGFVESPFLPAPHFPHHFLTLRLIYPHQSSLKKKGAGGASGSAGSIRFFQYFCILQHVLSQPVSYTHLTLPTIYTV